MGRAGVQVGELILVSVICSLLVLSCLADELSPKHWPEQFHAQLYQVNGKGLQAVIDLWYDYPKGRNFNIIQHQLSYKLYDVEWNNGTSFYFDLEAKTCTTMLFPVGILAPDWLEHSHYLGVEEFDGFTCNVWEKEDFITYYEDRETRKPVAWLFRTTGQLIHVITFEVGAVLGDSNWQSPSSCFTDTTGTENIQGPSHSSLLLGGSEGLLSWNEPWKRWLHSYTSGHLDTKVPSVSFTDGI